MKTTHHVAWGAASKAAQEGCVLQGREDLDWNRLQFGDGFILSYNRLALGPWDSVIRQVFF